MMKNKKNVLYEALNSTSAENLISLAKPLKD